MAHYLVEAKPHLHKLKSLRERLDQGLIKRLKPFGNTLHHSLVNARLKPDGFAVWEEEDYCSPPLAQERAAVLGEFFAKISVKTTREEEGWNEVGELPSLWDKYTF
ncbi:hypothetical protein HY229_04645 [Candidatus Acetothermia bacterium]|nr:hypothetical protein [Candidatus Acetothermia bacterium]MBI3643374.1 hypothetical protein [Candidatus Acetothermia bacterium]